MLSFIQIWNNKILKHCCILLVFSLWILQWCTDPRSSKKITVLDLGALRHTKKCHMHSYINSLLDVIAEVNLIKRWGIFTPYLSPFFDLGSYTAYFNIKKWIQKVLVIGATMQNLYSIEYVKNTSRIMAYVWKFSLFFPTKHAINGSVIYTPVSIKTNVIRVGHATYLSKCDNFKPLNRIINK